MIPKLLVSKNDTEIQNQIDLLIAKSAISPFDISSLGKENINIKIEEIRELKKKLNLKPFQGEKKLIIIYHAENLTTEAQNALLKSLEEPPKDTLLILQASNENLLLPTIISRCEITRIKSQVSNPLPADASHLAMQAGKSQINSKSQIQNSDLKQLLESDLGEKFAFAEKLASKIDKEETLENVRKRVEKRLDDLIEEIHSLIVVNGRDRSLLIMLKSSLLAKKQIKQNLNIRLVLENLLINL